MIVKELHAAIIACGVPSSLAAVWALWRTGPTSPTTVHMANMLLWDVVFVLISTPNTFGSQSWVAEHLTCRLYRAASEVASRMSTNSLVALAISEYLSRAGDPQLRAKAGRSCLIVMALWAMTVMQTLATMSQSRLSNIDCPQLHQLDPNKQHFATILDFACTLVLPVTMMLLFSVLLVTKSSKSNDVSADVSFITELNIRPRTQPTYSALVTALIIIFIIFNTPYYGHMVIAFLYEVIENFHPPFDESLVGLLIPLGFWGRYILSFLNPIVMLCVVCKGKIRIWLCKTTYCYMYCHSRERSKRISNIPILS